VPTIEALAYNLYDTKGLICPIMDARRNQVYTGVYRFEDHKLVTVIEQEAVSITELMEQLEALGEPVTFLGDGVPVFREQILEGMTLPVSFAPSHVSRQRAGAVAALGALYYKEGKIQSAMEHTPEYLRVSQAERERAEREKKA
jgi:tRNA A37 threonylcarbamoyladenosine modification protein TsaB